MDGFRIELLPSDGSLGLIRTFAKGTIVWARETKPENIFVVRRGEIEIFVAGHHAHDTVVRVVKPGEICGLYSFCEAQATPTTGRARVLTETLEIGCREFKEFLSRRPDVAISLLTTACERLAFAEERIHILAQRNAEDRILTLLLQLAKRSGRANNQNPELIRLRYTHLEFAQFCGMNRAHVTVVLNRLRDRDIVRYGRGTPTYIKMPALVEYLETRKAADSDSEDRTWSRNSAQVFSKSNAR